MIRAAAVSALAAFANGVQSLKHPILQLLKRCLDDSDDEVRERAYFYIVLLEKDLEDSILDDGNASLQDEGEEIEEFRDFVFDQDTNINIDALEAYLNANKDELMEAEEEINLDTSKMIVYGTPTVSAASSATSASTDQS